MKFENAIEVEGVTKHYPDFTLDHISFKLPTGCIMGLIGENGAGKSTTIKLIMDAIKKDAGQISVMGSDNESAEFSQIKDDIGIVLDEAYFPMVITADIVNKMMRQTYRNWDEKVYYAYLKKFDLPVKKQFRVFSRGMKMKLAIAVALSHDPKLLILDEATSGLDPIIRDEILEIFYDFTRDEAHSILISSHIVSDLEKLCDYIAFIHDGRLLLCEQKDELMDTYGILKCTSEQFADIPGEAIMGKRSGNYGIECLVKRDLVSSQFAVERAGLEEIILYMVKGDRK